MSKRAGKLTRVSESTDANTNTSTLGIVLIRAFKIEEKFIDTLIHGSVKIRAKGIVYNFLVCSYTYYMNKIK